MFMPTPMLWSTFSRLAERARMPSVASSPVLGMQSKVVTLRSAYCCAARTASFESWAAGETWRFPAASH